jgi:hypothetical protein
MVSIELTKDDLVVHVHGWDKLRALRSSLTIPLGHVTGVRVHPREAHFDDVIVDSWRGVGTYIPGKLAAGTCFVAGGRVFFDVRDPTRVIAIDVGPRAGVRGDRDGRHGHRDDPNGLIEKALAVDRRGPRADRRGSHG